MGKKEVSLFVGIFIVVLSMVHFGSSATVCAGGDDDIIMRLYPQIPLTNTHGALWFDTSHGYDEVICYSDFFGLPTPVNPHDVSGAGVNTVLFLSDTYNAHAEGPAGVNYFSEVYYGGLSCVLETGACTGGRTAIVKLSSATNAHLEAVSENNYPETVCCSIGAVLSECSDSINNDPLYDSDIDLADSGCVDAADDSEYAVCGDGDIQIPNDDAFNEECDNGVLNNGNDGLCNIDCTIFVPGAVQWEDLVGNVIGSADQGDTVRLVYEGAADNGNDFEIFEDDPPTWWDITDDSLGFFIGENSFDGLDWVTTWNIPVAGVVIGDVAEGDNNYEMYFEVDIPTQTSGILNIAEGSNNDGPIDGGPISPACGTRFNNLDVIQNITFTVFDSDDLLDVMVTVTEGDGTVSYEQTWEDTYQQNFVVLNHTFNVAGTTNIKVYAETNDGLDKFSAISNIIVTHPENTGVSYFAACIDEPLNFKHISTDYTFFNASSSRGFKRNTPTSCSFDCAQNTIYLPDTTVNMPGFDKQPLYFDWTFSDGRTHSGFGGGSVNDINWEFYKYFGQYGDNWADLTVSAS